MTATDIIERFAANAGKHWSAPREHGRVPFLEGHGSSLYYKNDYEGRVVEIQSYGSHFPLARLALNSDGSRRLWVLNGDRWRSGGFGRTNAHNDYMRRCAQETGTPWIILPFSALREAGIDPDTIEPQEVQEEKWVTERHSSPRLEDVPSSQRRAWNDASSSYVTVEPEDDGLYHWTTERHWLGASVFQATANGYSQARGYSSQRRSYLSSFDYNEPWPLYFLAELPAGASPGTVAEALEVLKPFEVRYAESQGVTVLRQGDVFAIPKDVRTRDLPGPSQHQAIVLGVNHRATEVRVTANGDTYARGWLRHARVPSEHHAIRLGDGKTWHELVKNTVEMHRAWTLGGNVD